MSCLRSAAAIVVMFLAAMAPAQAQICGDWAVDPGEQCDDGNQVRLDGCDVDCRYEQVQGLTTLELSGGTGPAACMPATNQLGQSLSFLGLESLNSALADGITDGSLDQTFVFNELDDPLGIDDATLELGVVGASPDFASPLVGLDSWHIGIPDHLDPQLLPAHVLPGSITASSLTAGPGDLELPMPTGSFRVRDGLVMASVNSLSSLPAPPPDTLAAALVAFETLTATAADQGLCGNVTVASLAAMPIPPDFASGGAFACVGSCSGSRSYTYCGDGQPVGPGCNSFLDLLISGCALPAFFCGAIIHPTQPDVGVGAAAANVLVADPTTGKVTLIEPDDAYSSYFSFTSQRVHLVNGLYAMFADGFESGDTLAWSGVTP